MAMQNHLHEMVLTE